PECIHLPDDAGLNLCVLHVFSDCREEQFPCTRLYSVHKPVKQCISYLCVTSMFLSALSSDEICRQLAGLPSRRLRRSGQLSHLPCKQILEQQLRRPDAL
ncbi:hypothetical protein CIB84_002883, partial [Bambusicola thoracicus]